MATQFATRQFADLAITNAKLAGSIATSKLTDGAEFIQRDGSVAMTANLNLNSNKITNLAAPTADGDAATKSYTDAVASGLDVKDSCQAATPDILDNNSDISGTPSYSNTGGASSRGQITATLAVSGTFAVDGVTLANDDRILLKDEATGGGMGGDANGIWVVTISGTSLTLDRATDFDEDAEVTNGAYTLVTGGSTYAVTGWVLTTADPITIGGASGTALTFSQFSGAGSFTEGDGINISGSVISVAAATAAGAQQYGGIVVNRTTDGSGAAGANAGFIAVQTDDSTLGVNASNQVIVKSAGITATQLNTSVAGNGLTGGGGSALALSLYATEVTAVGDSDVNNNPIYLDSTNGVNVKIDNSTIDLDSGNGYRLFVPNGGITETQLNTSVAGGGLAGGGGTALSVNTNLGLEIVTDNVNLNMRHQSVTNTGASTSSLSEAPFSISDDSTAALILTLNGQVLTEGGGADYTISGSTITWVGTPPSGDVVRAFYFV